MTLIGLNNQGNGTPFGFAQLGGMVNGIVRLCKNRVIHRATQIVVGIGVKRRQSATEGEGTFGRRPISGVVVDIVGPLVLIGMRLPATALGVADHIGDGSTKLLFEHGNIGGTRTLFISVVHVFLTSDHPGILLLKAVAARSEKTD